MVTVSFLIVLKFTHNLQYLYLCLQESVDLETPERGRLSRKRTIKKKKRVSGFFFTGEKRKQCEFLKPCWLFLLFWLLITAVTIIIVLFYFCFFPKVVSFRVKTTLPRMPKADPVCLNLFVFIPMMHLFFFSLSVTMQSLPVALPRSTVNLMGELPFSFGFSSTDFRKDASYRRGCGAAGPDPSNI